MLHMIAGIDEAGRGCWAGPLVAAAVVLSVPISGLADSKLLSQKRRSELAEKIKKRADFGLGWVYPQEIDLIGLTAATTKAMSMALDNLRADYTEVIIDGNYNYLSIYKTRKGQSVSTSIMIKADQLIPQASAASIIAKTARDQYMKKIALRFPGYGFERHIGYGTAEHRSGIVSLGPCAIHRMSYKPLRALTK